VARRRGNSPANNFAQPGGGGIPLPTFDPTEDPECALFDGAPDENYQLATHAACNSGGLFDENEQDQELNPGFAEEPNDPQLPPHLAPWASNIPVGDETQADELFFGLNTTMKEPMLEGFLDNFGPFNPASILVENFNMADGAQMAAWPNVNRVNHQGSFKAAPLRNVELSPPFFHNGGKLTLRQVLDFYLRGGDFPKTNAAHRDFLVMDLFNEDEALGNLSAEEVALATRDERITAVIDFLLELTDERVRMEQAPFDHPEIFVPLDGKAPDNTFGRPGFLTKLEPTICPGGSTACFKQIPAVGVTGSPTPVQTFLNVQKGDRDNPNCDSSVGPISHYCSEVH
jgi:hypothetical protein